MKEGVGGRGGGCVRGRAGKEGVGGRGGGWCVVRRAGEGRSRWVEWRVDGQVSSG